MLSIQLVIFDVIFHGHIFSDYGLPCTRAFSLDDIESPLLSTIDSDKYIYDISLWLLQKNSYHKSGKNSFY